MKLYYSFKHIVISCPVNSSSSGTRVVPYAEPFEILFGVKEFIHNAQTRKKEVRGRQTNFFQFRQTKKVKY